MAKVARDTIDIGLETQPLLAAIFDGVGETALLDARRLVRAGELAARACPGDDDYEAFGALFRAVECQLDLVVKWLEGARGEVMSLRSVRAYEDTKDPSA